MKIKRYSDAQIMGILKQAESGVPVSELCREHGMSNASFYKWRAKFGGVDSSMILEMKAMAEENRRLVILLFLFHVGIHLNRLSDFFGPLHTTIYNPSKSEAL